MMKEYKDKIKGSLNGEVVRGDKLVSEEHKTLKNVILVGIILVMLVGFISVGFEVYSYYNDNMKNALENMEDEKIMRVCEKLLQIGELEVNLDGDEFTRTVNITSIDKDNLISNSRTMATLPCTILLDGDEFEVGIPLFLTTGEDKTYNVIIDEDVKEDLEKTIYTKLIHSVYTDKLKSELNYKSDENKPSNIDIAKQDDGSYFIDMDVGMDESLSYILTQEDSVIKLESR